MTTALAPHPSQLAHDRRSSNRRARRQGSTAGNVIAAVGAWIIGLLFISPILWMLLTSLHSEQDASASTPQFLAPLTFDNYQNFFAGGQAIGPILNSVIASFSSTLLVILLAIPAAYALSVRPIEKWTDVMFFFLTTKMLPLVAGILPIYLIAKNLGLLDNINLLVVLYTSMNLPIAIWMLRSFLADIPVELFEAAALDGAGPDHHAALGDRADHLPRYCCDGADLLHLLLERALPGQPARLRGGGADGSGLSRQFHHR